MRDAFSTTLVELAQQDPRVILLTGDHGYGLFDKFRKDCPSQYVNAGIAEQNMVGMAAGLARVGYIPFVYGLAAFVPIRILEQLKLDIAHDGLHVVLLGDGAGFVYSSLGTSHQSTEDVAAVRATPGVDVVSPCDRHEMSASMWYAYAAGHPVYLRMGKSDRGDVHPHGLTDFVPGEMIRVRTGSPLQPTIIATGSMVVAALELAESLNSAVWSAPFIKPLSAVAVLAAVECGGDVIVIEEHSVYGGLGSAVAEIVSETNPVRVLRIGVNDRFSHMCGSYEYLLKEHELDSVSIAARAAGFLDA